MTHRRLGKPVVIDVGEFPIIIIIIIIHGRFLMRRNTAYKSLQGLKSRLRKLNVPAKNFDEVIGLLSYIEVVVSSGDLYGRLQ